MNIGPGNIEALLLDALEGRLSAAEAAEVWAALEAHPEWGVSWDFDDRDLPRLHPEEAPAMDWSGLKKEVVTDIEIRQAMRQDRDRHTLDARVKQSLYRTQERSLWRYWAAAASVALIIGLMWWGNKPTDTPAFATQVEQKQLPSSELYVTEIDTTSATLTNVDPIQLNGATESQKTIRAFVPEYQIIENCSGPPDNYPLDINPIAQVTTIQETQDTTSLEAPLHLPFELKPTETTTYTAENKTLSIQPTAQSYTPREWLKKKADQILRRAEADGTLPTVRREKEAFSLEWGSLSINTK